ncbi:PilN domain-containing protein [Neptunicella marina]|uniref:PilN domain-containing protein n=1 Tax=Neptunicella marina TaxID=2125989 RepID=A0A8J6M4H3_9ALTE|nr:PilN domain-containing protein [Neptunicella marina]MBC3766101.1 PilN domain-containing protein [Neptunicella marina]
MKYRVNLYLQELRPKVALYTLKFVVFVWGVAFLTMLAIGLWLQSSLTEINTKYDQQLQRSNQLQTELSALTRQLSQRTKSPVLLKKLDELTQTYQDKQYVMAELATLNAHSSKDFASLMQNLAKVHQEDLWLTRIKVNGNDVRFEGGVSYGDVVPQWLTELAKTPFFKGQKFAKTRIQRDENSGLSFVITTSRDDKTDEVQ